MNDIALLSRNDLTGKRVIEQFRQFFSKAQVYFDPKFPEDVWIDSGAETIFFQPSLGDQDMSDYEPGELPDVGFKPYMSMFTYHTMSFAAEVVKALLPLMGEGSLVDDEFGHIISAEAFIFKYGKKAEDK